MAVVRQVQQGVGYMNYLFFALLVIAAVVFLLDSSRSCGTAIDFCTISIFLLVFTISMLMLLVLSFVVGWPARYEHGARGGAFKYGSVKMFFLEDINLKQIILIPSGLFAVFVVSYLAILAHNPVAGIFASGAIMMGIFLYSNSALPVILIHGSYNALVVALRSQQLAFLPNFSQSPINVPDISFQLFPQQIINQMLTQILLVAPAEEVFKIFMVTVFIIIIKMRFNFGGMFANAIAGTISVFIWAAYHLQINTY